MTWIQRLNPSKSLFFRVFLGFWLAIVAIFIGSMTLFKYLDAEVKYLPLNPQQQADLSRTSLRLQTLIDKRESNIDLERLSSQWSKRNRMGLVLVNLQTRDIIQSNRRKRAIPNHLFDNMLQSSPPLLIEIEGAALFGPSLLRAENVDYLLFIHVPRPIGNLRLIRHEYPEVFILLLLTLSAGLCYLFVRGLLKPITQLSLASKQMAAGELDVRINPSHLRSDEIGQLGRDFNDMSEQVENLLLGQKRLLADISHELRSPLARLQLSIGIAQQDNLKNPSISVNLALERIEKEALQIETMIGQVLLLSRLDNAAPIQHLQDVELDQLMAPIIADAKFEAEQNNRNVRYSMQQNVTIEAEPALLSSAIENVIRNAIHYSHSLVEINISLTDANLTWVIMDDGEGCPDDELNKLFDAFYRQSTARDRNSGGVGLGLAIAHRAVTKHGGMICAENRSEGGLRVEISMPYIKP